MRSSNRSRGPAIVHLAMAVAPALVFGSEGSARGDSSFVWITGQTLVVDGGITANDPYHSP